MRTTLIALATVIGLSGTAFAMDAADKGTSTPVATQSDTIVTGTVQQSDNAISVPADSGYATKAGIDVNPNFLPGL